MACVMGQTRSKDAIEQMNEALRLMEASVKQLRSVVINLNEGKLEIVNGENDHDDR